MSTTQIAATLYQLQQVDLELERLLAEQQAVASSLQGNAALQKLRAEHNLTQQQLRSTLKTQREAEVALEDLGQRLTKQEQRLYSGNVHNQKELNALEQEIYHLRTQKSHQEEVVLEAMDTAETLQETVQLKAKALQQAEDAWVQQSANLVSRRDQLEVRWQELQTKREQLVASLDTELINRYDKIRRTRQGKAVSKVEQSSCQWCRVILTPSVLQRVRISSELQVCSNCGRILYFDR